MRILFCKVSSMKYYKGVCDQDIPKYGGSFVQEHGYGHEEYNFLPVETEDGSAECIGFVEPKSHKGGRNTFHLENIEGCDAMKKAPFVDDVLVIWCAKNDYGNVTVVGWYKHATVWRNIQNWTLEYSDGYEEDRLYNVSAKAENCTLLPSPERTRRIWVVRSAKQTGSYGFGQSMVWYPTEPSAKEYLAELIDNIEHYRDENWLHTYPEETTQHSPR